MGYKNRYVGALVVIIVFAIYEIYITGVKQMLYDNPMFWVFSTVAFINGALLALSSLDGSAKAILQAVSSLILIGLVVASGIVLGWLALAIEVGLSILFAALWRAIFKRAIKARA